MYNQKINKFSVQLRQELCKKKMKKNFHIFLILIAFVWSAHAQLQINLDAQNAQNKYLKYPVRETFYPFIDTSDLQNWYAINFNYKYYDDEKKNEALNYLWEIKIKNLPLEQKANLILNALESSSSKNNVKTLKIVDFLMSYNENYAKLSRANKLNLIKFDLTKDTKYSTPEVQKFLRLRQNQILPKTNTSNKINFFISL